jgi:hypothetical protein
LPGQDLPWRTVQREPEAHLRLLLRAELHRPVREPEAAPCCPVPEHTAAGKVHQRDDSCWQARPTRAREPEHDRRG